MRLLFFIAMVLSLLLFNNFLIPLCILAIGLMMTLLFWFFDPFNRNIDWPYANETDKKNVDFGYREWFSIHHKIEQRKQIRLSRDCLRRKEN